MEWELKSARQEKHIRFLVTKLELVSKFTFKMTKNAFDGIIFRFQKYLHFY